MLSKAETLLQPIIARIYDPVIANIRIRGHSFGQTAWKILHRTHLARNKRYHQDRVEMDVMRALLLAVVVFMVITAVLPYSMVETTTRDYCRDCYFFQCLPIGCHVCNGC